MILDSMISTGRAAITTTAVQSVPEPLGIVLALTGVLGAVAYAGWGRTPRPSTAYLSVACSAKPVVTLRRP